ncbi:MAG: hypothetical protein Q7S55_04400 [Nanoarchaeota archaeon]|nr:hypothetical protein [Nanoarchaeota archaeon]
MRYKTIAIKPELKQSLDSRKLCPTETYDHLIRRLLGNDSQ